MTEFIPYASLATVAVFAAMYLRSVRNALKKAEGSLRSAEEEKARIQQQLALTLQENARLSERLTLTERQMRQTEEMYARRLEKAEAEAGAQGERFRTIASEIMNASADRLKTQSETRLTEILTPLRGELDRFRKTVSDCYSAESRERFSLQERIKELIEANLSIGREARELTEALRTNSKAQGNWGEMILESILEKSGLRRGEEFTVQQTTQDGATIRNDAGRMLRPDVVVNYPDGRAVVIDSKMSLTAFVEYVNATSEEEQKEAGRRHVLSVRRHIDELARKEYQDYVGHDRTDFVMMFIPNESAYIAAMNLDSSLWQQAYDKRVLIVSPTHLVSALRLIAMLWSHDRQTRNAIEIAEQSGRMYDKFAGFVDDMDKIRKGIDSLNSIYDQAMGKLTRGTGNLVSRAEKLRELGAKTKKQLSVRPLPTENGRGEAIPE